MERLRTQLYFAIGMLLCSSIAYAGAQTDIRQVDFKNFSYPWFFSYRWPHKMVWLDTSNARLFRLVNGQRVHDSGNGLTHEGLTLEEVQFADVTGDGHTDAIVVLRSDTGGTQFSYYVYVYSLADGKPRLLACFHSGDRAASGLYKVYEQNGELIVELFDPTKSTGDCCSLGFIRTRYRWHNTRFVAVGRQEFGTPATASRLPVSVFGNHQ